MKPKRVVEIKFVLINKSTQQQIPYSLHSASYNVNNILTLSNHYQTIYDNPIKGLSNGNYFFKIKNTIYKKQKILNDIDTHSSTKKSFILQNAGDLYFKYLELKLTSDYRNSSLKFQNHICSNFVLQYTIRK